MFTVLHSLYGNYTETMTNNICYKNFFVNNGVMQISKEIANESLRLHSRVGVSDSDNIISLVQIFPLR